MKKYLTIFVEEFAKHGLGWTIGLMAANFVSQFFVIKSWKNMWGITTSRAAVSESAMTIIEFVTEGIIGFAVFIIINKIVSSYWKRKGAKVDD